MKTEKHYNVRSMALRGEDDETLEVCIASDEADMVDTEADCSVCSSCPPACSDPNCVACLQKCPHVPDTWQQSTSGHQHPHYARRQNLHMVKHNKYRDRHHGPGYQGWQSSCRLL